MSTQWMNGRFESLPDTERKLKYIHSSELWDAIMEILNMLVFMNTINIEAESSRTIIITKDWFAKICCLHIIWLLLEISFIEIPTRKMLIFVLPRSSLIVTQNSTIEKEPQRTRGEVF
jgi:hypothetical protein